MSDILGVDASPTHYPVGQRRGPRNHTSAPDETLRMMLHIMQEETEKQEKNALILQENGYCDYQLLSSFPVPFDYNALTLCVGFGVVAVTCNTVTAVAGGNVTFPLLPLVDTQTPIDYLYGAMGITCGDTLGSPIAVPQALFVGPQQIKFTTRRAGQISFWVHPSSLLNYRHNINPNLYDSTLIMMGQVMYLPD